MRSKTIFGALLVSVALASQGFGLELFGRAKELNCGGCNACHAASTGSNWKSYGWAQVQAPLTDPADYVQWNAGAGNTGNYVTNP